MTEWQEDIEDYICSICNRCEWGTDEREENCEIRLEGRLKFESEIKEAFDDMGHDNEIRRYGKSFLKDSRKEILIKRGIEVSA